MSGSEDHEIDNIIWSEIETSQVKDDFINYLVHRPQGAQYVEQAWSKLAALGENSAPGLGKFVQAVVKVRDLADAGNHSAMFHMGKFYANGTGVVKDLKLAEAWYLKGIEKQDLRCLSNLGWLYQNGLGDAAFVDSPKAFQLLNQAAERGNNVAKASVGTMLVAGEGCVADTDAGLQVLEQAFEAGYDNAANHIADTYILGRHVPRDVVKGYAWLDKAVARGDARTMAILGHYLITGRDGIKDIPRGLALMEQAVSKGHAEACRWLGALYEKGQSLEHDLNKAQFWYEKGVAAGDQGAGFYLGKLLEAQSGRTPTAPMSLH